MQIFLYPGFTEKKLLGQRELFDILINNDISNTEDFLYARHFCKFFTGGNI